MNPRTVRTLCRSMVRPAAWMVLCLGLASEAAAAPIPVKGLIQGFSPAIQYEISPDGRRLLRRRLGTAELKLFPVSEGGEVGEPFDLSRHRIWLPLWMRDGRRLLGLAPRRKSLVAVEIDPEKPDAHPREIRLPGIDGRVVRAGRHPAEDGRLLLWTYGRGGESVLHCELNGTGCSRVSGSSDGGAAWRFIIDENGRPAARHRFFGTSLTFEAQFGGEWRKVGEIPVDRTVAALTPVDAEGWGLALSNRTLDAVGLVRWNVRTLEERPVLSEPDADLQQVLLSASNEPLAATSFPGYPRTTALHPAAERVLDVVRAHHPAPALFNVTTVNTSLDRFVVEVFDESRARVAYLVALPEGTVDEFDRSEAGRQFAKDFSPTRAVRIPTRDGLELPGLLTIPREREGSGPPPLVLMVHGGPWLFYRWTFDPLPQLLASRGYAVLKVNYRGSAGYGTRFREAAVGELAGRVQDDIEDAFDWAIREGHGNRSRLAILGDSFGGFSVLTTMIRGRVPVRAGVVLNGVVDTEAMVEENTFAPEGQALWAKYLGTRDVDELRRVLREASPLRHIDSIRPPVLFVTGNADRTVQARHAEALVAELRERGREARLLAFPREGHSIARPANVVKAYRALLKFLDRHVD